MSNLGTLNGLFNDIKEVLRKHTGQKDIGFAIALTLPSENYKKAHWITNLSGQDSITLFRKVT